MQTSSPAAAAVGPPVTPQSSTGTPRAAASAPMAWTHGTEMVLTMMMVVPGPAAARPPSGPDSTAWTWASSTTATTTTSDCPTRSAGDPATVAVSAVPVGGLGPDVADHQGQSGAGHAGGHPVADGRRGR